MLSVSTQIAREDDLNLFERMLKSVSFADEIRIYTMDRNDQELKSLVTKYHAIKIPVKTPKVVEVIRTRQVREAKGDWVLIMDFDEIITPALRKEIIEITAAVPPRSPAIAGRSVAYKIKRKNFSLGYPISHGGFGDDYVHRLFQKKYFMDWPQEIHSTPEVNGRVDQLKNYMEHHKDASLSQMVAKTNRYSDIESQQFFEGGLPPVTRLTLIRKPVMEFIRRYFIKLGFLDGRIGLIQSIYQGYSVFITYSKLYERQKSAHR